MKNGKIIYSVEMTNAAHKIYKKFDPPLKNKIKEEANILKDNPHKHEELSGFPFNIRSFHFNFHGVTYRIAYTIDEKEKMIYIKLVLNRENFYEKLKRILNMR